MSNTLLLLLCAAAFGLNGVLGFDREPGLIHICGALAFLTLRTGTWWQALLIAVCGGLGEVLRGHAYISDFLLVAELCFMGLLGTIRRDLSLRTRDLLFWGIVTIPFMGLTSEPWLTALADAALIVLCSQVNVSLSAVVASLIPLSFVRRRVVRSPLITTQEYLASWIVILFVLPAVVGLISFDRLQREFAAGTVVTNSREETPTHAPYVHPLRLHDVIRWIESAEPGPMAAASAPGALRGRSDEAMMHAIAGDKFATWSQTMTLLLAAVSLIAGFPAYAASRRVAGPMNRALHSLARACEGPALEYSKPDLLMLAPRIIARHVARVTWRLRREQFRVLQAHVEQQAILEASPIVLMSFELLSSDACRPLRISPSLERVFGWKTEEVRDEQWFLSRVHPDDAIDMAELAHAIRLMPKLTRNYRWRAKNGRYRHVHSEFSKVRDLPDGAVLASGIIIDVTDLEEARRAAESNNRLALLGTFSAGIAHELKQPLNVIGMTASNLREHINTNYANAARGDCAYCVRKLDRITEQVTRADGIMQDLRDAAPGRRASHSQTDLREIVARIADLTAGDFRKLRIGLVVDCPSTPMIVRADSGVVEQVIFNLVANARDAIVDARPARVTPRVDTVTVRIAAAVPEKIVIRVSDTGPGIAVDALERLFEPFFSTKADAQNMGLGLFIVKNLVQSIGGRIRAANTPDGAVFEVDLPGPSGGAPAVAMGVAPSIDAAIAAAAAPAAHPEIL